MKMLWCSVFSLLFFSLKSTVRKNIWVRTTSVIVMVTFLKCHSESYLIIARLKVPFQQLWSTLTTAFWNTPYNWGFFGHGSTYLLILSSWLDKISCNENRRSCLESYKLHKNSSLYFEQYCTKTDHIWLIFKCFFFSQMNLVFKFNLAFIGILENFCHNLFTCFTFGYYL